MQGLVLPSRSKEMNEEDACSHSQSTMLYDDRVCGLPRGMKMRTRSFKSWKRRKVVDSKLLSVLNDQ